jgi:hypothetical protein
VQAFCDWLFLVEGRVEVSEGVLAGYEEAFRDELRKVIARTHHGALRAHLVAMLDCPIRDARGQCRSFTDYIYAALIRNGVHRRYDIEAALAYVVERMLMPTTDTGEPRDSLFRGFQERPDYAGGNPLQPRFLTYLDYAIQNIRKGKIVRLGNVERRPQGTVSISQGRRKESDPAGGIPAEAISARTSADAGLAELVADILDLLRQKEAAYQLPLTDLFRAIMAGERKEEQVRRFGDRPTRAARKIIVSTIRHYADRTSNHRLLYLLGQFEGFNSNKAMPVTRQPARVARPKLSDQERDYRSIADVVGRFEVPVGTSDLGRYRRRWLEYPPRDPASGHRNRLEEVLAAMVRDGVLRANRTASGASVYSPGPNFGQYRGGVSQAEAVLAAGLTGRFRDYLEGLLLPDRPAVPGTSRLNTTLYPRSRYRVNPQLRPQVLARRPPAAVPPPKLAWHTRL